MHTIPPNIKEMAERARQVKLSKINTVREQRQILDHARDEERQKRVEMVSYALSRLGDEFLRKRLPTSIQPSRSVPVLPEPVSYELEEDETSSNTTSPDETSSKIVWDTATIKIFLTITKENKVHLRSYSSPSEKWDAVQKQFLSHPIHHSKKHISKETCIARYYRILSEIKNHKIKDDALINILDEITKEKEEEHNSHPENYKPSPKKRTRNDKPPTPKDDIVLDHALTILSSPSLPPSLPIEERLFAKIEKMMDEGLLTDEDVFKFTLLMEHPILHDRMMKYPPKVLRAWLKTIPL